MTRSIFEKTYVQAIIGGLTVSYIIFLQFYKLNELPVVQWDESRLAVNAAEMYQNGNFLVTTFENNPDLYNTKPPLMIWLQVMSAYIFGMNEFSLRFPAALAGFICILFCAYIVFKRSSSYYAALFAALLLAFSDGFIQLHGSLTGDYDALLSLFVLLAIYHFHNFLFKRSDSALMRFGIFFSLAILSKSAAALLVMPLVFSSLVFKPDIKRLLKTALACLLSLLPFLIYCILRENAAEGYIDAVIQNDFWGRFSSPLEGHTSEWYYYIVNLFTYRYSILIWVLPPALICGLIYGKKTIAYFSLVFCVYLLFLSIAQTRIHWYDMPLLPIISIIIALFFHFLYQQFEMPAIRTGLIAVICAACIYPAQKKFEFIAFRSGLQLDMSHYELSNKLRKYKESKQCKYLAAPYDPEFYFYSVVNPSVTRGNYNHLRINDIVFHGNLYKDSLQQKYLFKTLDSGANTRKILILDYIKRGKK